MPTGIYQPSNQIKLTNVSLVRMKKGKKRFEIACYKNKVLEYRNGAEKDLDNVLQIPNVFLNVSKGQVASHDDLAKAFGKDDKGKPMTSDAIILEILNKGELQVGDKERQAELDRVHNEVIDIVAGKLVDPKSKRVYTTGMIDKALDQLSQTSHQIQQSNNSEAAATPPTGDGAEAKPKKNLPVWTGVVTTKSAKSQALDAMKALIAHQPIPVARARMRLRITCPANLLKQAAKTAPKAGAEDDDAETKATGTVKDRILSYVEQVESQDVSGSDWEVIGFVEPGAFKQLTEFIGGHTKGKARAEVLDMAVVHEGE
ncbi:Shwachman-Bodian-diamond syndrome protein [Microthyrium microscopicum]|uniref:Ribosome maturation protein SDO1 n=1 Tax=Microthyrium microscopicum TaxID=703497 RepID=A0A6A6TXY0_9PEZI|nr:Shwachman-Bodian-diamond syndrome protein [Microthyrium microscopicum]